MDSPHPFAHVTALRNRYFALRHGHSIPQEKGIILSYPDNAVDVAYGLSDYGRGQARRSAREAKDAGVLDAATLIVSSDFSRALQTAEVFRDVLVCEFPSVDERLRERHFGTYEFKTNASYPQIWAKDVLDGGNTDAGVESPDHVQARFAAAVLDCEAKWSGKKIVLVGHGDLLQIGETNFRRLPASEHRGLKHLENAEVRELTLALAA